MVSNVRRGNVIAYLSLRPGLSFPSEPRANLATTACAKTAYQFCYAQQYALSDANTRSSGEGEAPAEARFNSMRAEGSTHFLEPRETWFAPFDSATPHAPPRTTLHAPTPDDVGASGFRLGTDPSPLATA